jgi:hypothetical protein
MTKIVGSRSGIRDKHPGSATLVLSAGYNSCEKKTRFTHYRYCTISTVQIKLFQMKNKKQVAQLLIQNSSPEKGLGTISDKNFWTEKNE